MDDLNQDEINEAEFQRVANILISKFNLARDWDFEIGHDGTVDLIARHAYFTGSEEKLPIKFEEASGNFSLSETKLTTLEGCPHTVLGTFSCASAKITSFIGGPKIVKGSYYASRNNISSLEGLPTEVFRYLDLERLPLTSLEFLPKMVAGTIDFTVNANLPLLRLLSYPLTVIFKVSGSGVSVHEVMEIVEKYQNKKPLRQAIIQCQKELLDAGFAGNARL